MPKLHTYLIFYDMRFLWHLTFFKPTIVYMCGMPHNRQAKKTNNALFKTLNICTKHI